MAKSIQELTITSDFLFSVIMRQEKYCRPLLEYILKVKIKKLVYINDQETIQSSAMGAKSIRLDVYVEDDANTVYDLEVQTTDKKNLGKRTRYYQSLIDIRVLEKGQDYKKLKKSFVIFICDYDPFGKSQYIYTFRNRCDEVPGLVLKDEAAKIIVNIKGTEGNISDELKAVIHYMNSGETLTEYTKALDEEVEIVKSDEKVRKEYMLMMEAYARQRSLGQEMTFVRQIRRKMNTFSVEEMADIFDIAPADCEAVVELVTEHPDWDDEHIAGEVDWEY